MQVKVCGIKYQQNLEVISKLPIDMIGLNFYPKSKRYLDDPLDVNQIPDAIKKVGVFVNAKQGDIERQKEAHQLDMAQLHGDESPIFCQKIQQSLPITKVFSIASQEDIKTVEEFAFADFFLFDTKGASVGGTGQKFDWSILEQYTLDVPFLLAGGIGPEDFETIKKINHPQFAGVDINSKFEIKPGLKSAELVAEFVQKINQ